MKYNFTVFSDIKLLPFLSDNLAGIGIGAIKKQLKQREVKVNGARVNEDIFLKKNDIVEIFVPQMYETTAPNIAIVYEDDNIVVADKPVLIDVEHHLVDILKKDREYVRAAHRLDRNTTGLIILAKNEDAYDELYLAMKNHTIQKTYNALVYGVAPKDSDTISAYLYKDAKMSFCYISDTAKPGYIPITTQYKVIEKLDNGLTKLELKPITGRTHQLRAHMAHIGCPIVGDNKYGLNAINAKYKYKYQQLRCVKIRFDGLGHFLEYLNGKEIYL